MMAELQARGEAIDEGHIAFLRAEYGLDRPLHEQYFIWLWGLCRATWAGRSSTTGRSPKSCRAASS